jgi:hypothetical protein
LIRALPFLLAGGLLTSCSGSPGPADVHRIFRKGSDGGTAPAVPAETNAAFETPESSPYRVAVFPDGAEILLFSPQPDTAVADPWVDVIGKAPAETVITFNEEIAVAAADGMFSVRVPLEAGLNEIQCVASDLEGNEVEFSIIVEYEPQEE